MTSIAHLLRAVAIVLIVTITSNSFSYAAPPSSAPIDETVLHQKLITRGIGKGLKVTEIDGTVIKGTLVTIDDGSFQLTPKQATQPTRILNSQVAKLGNDGMSTRAKVTTGVIVGIVVGIAIIVIAIAVSVEKSGY